MPRPDSGVELLERALGYTRGALLHVRPAHLHRPTPCAGWSLDQLLDHMHDALDAFTEGADGTIAAEQPRCALDVRVATLQAKACGLLGAWSRPSTPDHVLVGGLPVPTAVITRAAALEITTPGWDVAQATGRGTPVPDDLARELGSVAVRLVDPADRGTRFAPPLHPGPGAGPGEALLAFLGRSALPGAGDLTGPVAQVSLKRGTAQRPAS